MHWLLGLPLLSHVKVNSWKTVDHLMWRCVATSYCNDVILISSPKEMVLKDLIQNVHTIFDERRPLSPPVPSPDVPETTPAPAIDSFLSPEPPGSADVQAISTPGQHHPSLVGGIPVLAQLSFSSLLLDTASESHLTPSPNSFINPIFTDSQRRSGDSYGREGKNS